jgi:hypothetical protein
MGSRQIRLGSNEMGSCKVWFSVPAAKGSGWEVTENPVSRAQRSERSSSVGSIGHRIEAFTMSRAGKRRRAPLHFLKDRQRFGLSSSSPRSGSSWSKGMTHAERACVFEDLAHDPEHYSVCLTLLLSRTARKVTAMTTVDLKLKAVATDVDSPVKRYCCGGGPPPSGSPP